MEVHFTPELEKRLNEIALQSGQETDELVQYVIAGYVGDLAEVRQMLDSRYDDLKNGNVAPVDGEDFFEALRRRENELLAKRTPQ
jgi:hypothetical protein